MNHPFPTMRGEFIDDDEQHLSLEVGDFRGEPYATLSAKRGEKQVDVDFSADVYQDTQLDLWDLVRASVEGHLDAKLPHPEVVAWYGKTSEMVMQPFMRCEEYAELIGWCDG